jgi:hypothetical protein
MPDPLPVIPLQYATADEARRRPLPAISLGLLWLGWIAGVLTVGAIAFIDVRSVLVAGPIVFVAGLVGLLGGMWVRAMWAIAAGLAHCAVCGFFVALVNLLNWGPDRAREPFLWMGLAYCVLSLPLVALAHARRGRASGG